MPRVTEETAHRRRQQIVDAALRCFARDGLHHTSMADLFEEAGMSAGLVYSWFASKDDIIEAAYRGSGTASAAAMTSALQEDPLTGIAEVLHTAAQMFDDPGWRRTSRVNGASTSAWKPRRPGTPDSTPTRTSRPRSR